MKKLIVLFAAFCIVFTAVACRDDTPAEKAAKQVDKAVEKTKKLFQ